MSGESSSPRQLLERCHRLVTHSQFIKAWPPVLRSVHQAHLCHSGEASDSLSWTGNGTAAFYSRALATQSDGLKGLHRCWLLIRLQQNHAVEANSKWIDNC